MDKQSVREYFSTQATRWVQEGYADAGYNYPTPWHRRRLLMEVVREHPQLHSALDLGCGGGQVSLALAQAGLEVIALDASEEMLRLAQELVAPEPAFIRQRIHFLHQNLEKIDLPPQDLVNALGVIGYFPDDGELLTLTAQHVRPGGYVVVSFRNRLFNLFSLSWRTQREVDNGDFAHLAQEAAELYQPLDGTACRDFLRHLHEVTGELLAKPDLLQTNVTPPSVQAFPGQTPGTFEPRQSTPKEVMRTAEACGLECVKLLGVHPHLTVPPLNAHLPSGVYNKLSDALCAFEQQPMALLWSSVFMGVFRQPT